ncbi:MAG: hypothetical protein ACLGIC_04095 [Acidimicrobiia bacterium]
MQRQAAGSLRLTLAFLVAAAGTAVLGVGATTWLPLHLLLVGGVLTAIGAATQLLAVTWSASPAPSDRLAAAQRWSVAVGAVAVAAGRELDVAPVVAGGATTVAVGLALLAASLVRIRAQRGNDRFLPAIDGYLLALGFGAAGVAIGAWMATTGASDSWPRWRAAHITLNVFGLVGLVIAATLPTFVATQARTRTSRRATARAQRLALGALGGAVVVTAAGQVVASPSLTAAGRVGYVAGFAVLLTVLPRIRQRHLRWAGPRLVQLAAGITWWIAATAAMVTSDLDGRTPPGDLVAALAVGGVAQVVVASLAYLAPVLRAGGHERLTAGFATTRSWPSLVAANIAAAGLLMDADRLVAVALSLWAVDVVARAAQFRRRRGASPPQRCPAPEATDDDVDR